MRYVILVLSLLYIALRAVWFIPLELIKQECRDRPRKDRPDMDPFESNH